MMLTVIEAINSSAVYLDKKGIKSARLNSELLLAHVLCCKRLALYLSFDRPLQKDEIDSLRELIKRRSTFEPLQYIIGKVEFYGLEFEVNPSVLIPRPETELLVEKILNSVEKEEPLRIMDIGCGSGNISVVLAKYLPNAFITAIDISKSAIQTAENNAKLNSVEKQFVFLNKNILNGFEIGEDHFDVIVSNPPYVSSVDFVNLEPELRLYEPKIALTDENDGLTFYRKISVIAKSILKDKGKLFFEIGAGQSQQVKNILSENGFARITIVQDYSEIDRIIIGERI